MTTSVRISVIGTGNVGGNLGTRLAKAGYPVQFGAREGKDVSGLLAKAGNDATSATPEAAAGWGDVVFLAVPGSVAVDAARSLAPHLAGKILIDCNNPLTWDEGPVWAPPEEGSLSAAIAKAVPNGTVVKAFNTFGAEFHAEPGLAGVPADVYMASDDIDAKKTVHEIASRAGFHPVDAGPLRNAALLENLAMLWIHLATVGGHGRDFAFTMQRKDA
jgi:8-hydroxy-5-deazaflavin:NADPH oxidoreductase